MSDALIVIINPNQSDHPSPICSSLNKQPAAPAPPVNLVEIPCPYSCATIPLSKSPSIKNGPLFTNVADKVCPPNKAAIIASPSV